MAPKTEKNPKGAGRKKGTKASKVVMGEEHRAKIKNSSVLNRLIRHAEGKEPDMQSSEVNAGMGLLGFAFPKLQAIDPNTGQSGLTINIGPGVKKT